MHPPRSCLDITFDCIPLCALRCKASTICCGFTRWRRDALRDARQCSHAMEPAALDVRAQRRARLYVAAPSLHPEAGACDRASFLRPPGTPAGFWVPRRACIRSWLYERAPIPDLGTLAYMATKRFCPLGHPASSWVPQRALAQD